MIEFKKERGSHDSFLHDSCIQPTGEVMDRGISKVLNSAEVVLSVSDFSFQLQWIVKLPPSTSSEDMDGKEMLPNK